MNLTKKRTGFVVAGLVLFTLAMAQSAGEPIKRLLAGSGLMGGGPGPSVTVAIAPGGVTSEHIQDGTIELNDISGDAQDALRGSGGGIGMRVLHADGPSFTSMPPNIPTSTTISFTLTHRALVHLTCHNRYGYDLAANGATGHATCSTALILISLAGGAPISRTADSEMRVGSLVGDGDLTFPAMLEPGSYDAYVVRSPQGGNVFLHESSVDVDIVESP
jgi:hypothetical protein